MKKNSDLSFSGILVIGLLLSTIISGIIFGVITISRKFTPDVNNAEKLLRQGKLDEAAAVAERIQGNDYAREIVRGKIFLGLALEQMKKNGWNFYGTDPADWLKGADADSALIAFKRAQRLRPDALPAWFYSGIVCKEKGWYDRAEDDLLHAVQIDSGDVNTRLALGSLYVLQGRLADARTQLETAAASNSGNAVLEKNLAFLYRFHLFMPESAAVSFVRYLACADPTDVDIQRAETELAELRQRYPEFSIPDAPVAENGRKKRQFIPRN